MVLVCAKVCTSARMCLLILIVHAGSGEEWVDNLTLSARTYIVLRIKYLGLYKRVVTTPFYHTQSS